MSNEDVDEIIHRYLWDDLEDTRPGVETSEFCECVLRGKVKKCEICGGTGIRQTLMPVSGES